LEGVTLDNNNTKSSPLLENIPEQFKKCNIIPLQPRTKIYNGKLSNDRDENNKYTWKPYQTLSYNTKLLRNYHGNLAVILGDPFGEGKHLVQIDIDDPKLLKYFEGSGTLINKSGEGYHVFIYTPIEERARNNYPIKGIEIRTHSGQYCPIPPSIHPNGKSYEVYEDNPILGMKDGIGWVKERLEPLKDQFVKDTTYKTTAKPFPQEDDRTLSENNIDSIVSLIRKIYEVDYRNNIIYALSGLMKKEFVSIGSAEQVIKRLTELDEEKEHRLKVLHRTYEGKLSDTEIKGMSGIKEIAFAKFQDEAQAKSVIQQLSKLISAPPGFNELARTIGDSTAVVINKQKKHIVRRNYKTNQKGEVVSTDNEIINAYPTKVKIIISPLEGEDRLFDIKWDSYDSPRPIHTGPGTGEEIIDQLKSSSYTTNSRQAYDLIGPIISAYQRAGNVEITTDTEKPGIYYKKSNEGICAINFEIEEYTKDEIEKAIQIIERLGYYYKDDRDKLSTSIKWGLCSAFAYTLKSSGRQWMPGLAHIGAGKTGKTTLGYISLYLWVDDPKKAQTVAGGFDTPYRMGEALSHSTFPVLINELAGVFEKIEMVEILKTAIEQTTSRAKARGGRLKHIPALALPLITSNHEMPNDDALRRRMHTLHYTYGEQREEVDIKAFEEEFKVNKGGKTELNSLRVLGYFVINLIKKNPELLDLEWQELGNRLIREIYEYTGEIQPSWLAVWADAETLEDLREDRIEEIREMILDDINNSRRAFWQGKPATGEMLKTFAEEGYIPWLKLHVFKDGMEGYAIGKGFVRTYNKCLGRVESLKGISEILGWKYGDSRLAGKGKHVLVESEQLENFLFQRYSKKEGRTQMEIQ